MEKELKSKEELEKLPMAERLWIKVGDEFVEIDRNALSEDEFDVDFNGAVMVKIQNTNGEFSVVNAVNGYGQNCRDEYKHLPVTFLTAMFGFPPSFDPKPASQSPTPAMPCNWVNGKKRGVYIPVRPEGIEACSWELKRVSKAEVIFLCQPSNKFDVIWLDEHPSETQPTGTGGVEGEVVSIKQFNGLKKDIKMALEREIMYEKALRNLCHLKKWKDEHGKDSHYEQFQPEAWSYAFGVLKDFNVDYSVSPDTPYPGELFVYSPSQPRSPIQGVEDAKNIYAEICDKAGNTIERIDLLRDEIGNEKLGEAVESLKEIFHRFRQKSKPLSASAVQGINILELLKTIRPFLVEKNVGFDMLAGDLIKQIDSFIAGSTYQSNNKEDGVGQDELWGEIVDNTGVDLSKDERTFIINAIKSKYSITRK